MYLSQDYLLPVRAKLIVSNSVVVALNSIVGLQALSSRHIATVSLIRLYHQFARNSIHAQLATATTLAALVLLRVLACQLLVLLTDTTEYLSYIWHDLDSTLVTTSMIAYSLQYEPWWLGICPGHPRIHMDHTFLLSLGGFELSLESHILPLSAWMQIIHDLVAGHSGLIHQDQTASTRRYVSSVSQHHSSSSSAWHHIETRH